MARARAGQSKQSVRNDPPATMLDPSQQMLALKRANGKGLIVDERGTHDGRFQYVWVDKGNAKQFIRYQALQYQPVRRGPDEVKPRFEFYQNDETGIKDGDVVLRAELILMKRPLDVREAEMAAARRFNDQRLEEQGLIDRALATQAAQGSMRLTWQGPEDG